MPKRSNEFQRLITFIYKEYENEDISVIESSMVKEVGTGMEREIDIHVKGRLGGHPISLGIECRDRKRKADTTWIDELYGKYRDLPIDRLIAVSKSGFAKTAVEKAKLLNIETFSLENIDDINWLSNKERVTKWKSECQKIVVPGIEFIFSKNTSVPENIDSSLSLYDKQGCVIGTIDSLVSYFSSIPDAVRTTISKDVDKNKIEFPVGVSIGKIQTIYPCDFVYLSSEDISYPIAGIKVYIECTVEVVEPEIDELRFSERYIAKVNPSFESMGITFVGAAIESESENGFRFFFNSESGEVSGIA